MVSGISFFQGNRYQIIRKLGEGGKGIVFLCQDTVLARRVAIKLIKEEVLDAEGLLRFQREVQAMASLVHPNVVTVFDIGQEEGRQFLVLELMEGGDVEQLIAASPNQRLDAGITIRIGKEVARALEHAHRHSILHRDIKPGNIWLTRDGQAKLGDFGLAYLGGGPKLTRAGMMVGSVAYMAPEVALGKQADARSDLYMLGTSFYEMATGRVPFPGDDPVRVLFSHINDLPLPPRRFAPDIPDGLEALILRLLSKDPEQRPASAADVLQLLDEAERSVHGIPGTVEAPLAAPSQGVRLPTPEPRFAQPLVGREREVGFLRQRVDAALRSEGSLIFITGEAGIGKTRLASEVRPYARGRGFLWLEGHYPREASTPFQAWVEAIRAFLRGASPSLLMKVLLPYAAELARLVPEVAERLGRASAPPSIGPEEERLRLYEAIAGFFTAIAREQPLVLFLDDLQWAASIDTLHHLASSVSAERLLLLATYRDAELEEKSVLARTLLAMNRERLFHPLSLKRLTQREVGQMVAHILGEGASAKVSATVSEKTEGNPFFVEEVVRYLTESGAITLGTEGWEVRDSTMVQLPRSVKAVVAERLERLGEESRGILAWASVVGQQFSLPLLKEVTGQEEEKLLDVVDQAVEARVLTALPTPGQETYSFVDEVMVDVLYEGIGPARRRRYHLKVGQAVEKVHARRLEEHYDALARHFLEGNGLEQAVEYAIKAGDRGSSVYSWERASRHYRTALELLEELATGVRQQAEVLEKLALVTTLGKGKGALGYWAKALSLYETLADGKKAAGVHLQLAQQYSIFEMGGVDWERAYSHCLKAVALLEPEGESPQVARAYARSGFCAFVTQREPAPTAIALIEKALALAEHLGDAAGATEAAWMLGIVSMQAGEVTRGLELVYKCCEAAMERDDPVLLSLFSTSLSLNYAWLRDAESALRWAEQSVESSRQSGTSRNQLYASLDLAGAYILWGEAPRALLGLETAEQVAKKGGVEVSQPSVPAVTMPGVVHFFLGDWEKAETELLRCLEAGKQAHFIVITQPAAVGLGQLYLEQGDLISAQRYLGEAVTIAEASDAKKMKVAPCALLAQVASKSGDMEEAAAHLRRAQQILANGEAWYGLAAEVHHAEGILAAAQQNWPEAEAAFQKAVEINRQYHLPYFEARSLLEWGEMYLARNSGDDRQKGMELLDQALVIFQGVQAKKMVEKVLGRKELLKA